MGKYKVVLDPGHGQFGNPYPTAEGFYEGTQMYKLMLMLRKKLESSGIDVVVTRNQVSDDPALDVRGKTAGKCGADMFISLHSDAIGNYVSTSARGVSVYYSIQDAANNKKFATNLSNAVANLMGTRNRGPMTRIGNGGLDYYGVIRNSAASGCKTAFLIEHGFHSNPTDVKWLIDDNKLAQIADVDASVICDWFGVVYQGKNVGNSATVVPSTSISSTDTYVVYKEIPKFLNAANALNGDGALAVGTLTAGTYYVYKTYQGAYNLTKTVGTAGSWINPNDNTKPVEPEEPKDEEILLPDDDGDGEYDVGEIYELYKEVRKYSSAGDAKAMINGKDNAEVGTYYIYKIHDGMLNLSTKKSVAGFWMNPAHNIYTAFGILDTNGKQATIEKNDIVIFRSGFTPKYGNNGATIPLSVIASVNGNKTTKVVDFIVRNTGAEEEEYEVKLDTINSWVPIKYLEMYKKHEVADDVPADEIPETPLEPDITEDDEEDAGDKLINLMNDEKYVGIRNAIKTGLLSQFLEDVINILGEDDVVDDTPVSCELILGKSIATKKQIVDFIQHNNPDFDPAIAEAFLTIGEIYGVRGDVAICQSIVETGWFKFEGGTAVKPSQHNYCGLGVTSLGVTGHSFETIRIGVEAQIQHLYAYASTKNIPIERTLYDPRFHYVTRGCAPRWVDLDGKWCIGAGYGEKIMKLWSELVKM